jgi:hypothetical protein
MKFHMASLSKLVAVSLTTLSWFAPTLASLSKPAFAEEIYLDKSCRQNQRLPELDRFVVFYKTDESSTIVRSHFAHRQDCSPPVTLL